MSVVTLDFAPEDDPLGIPVESFTEADLTALKFRISINEIGGGQVVLPRAVWEASVLNANKTYYCQIHVPYIHSTAPLFGLWFKGGQFLLADAQGGRGAENATLVGFGPMYYLRHAILANEPWASHTGVKVRDGTWYFRGKNFGQLLNILVVEDQASDYPVLAELDSPGWNNSVDVDGNPWDAVDDIFARPVGNNYIDAIREIQRRGDLDAWMTPQLNLRAYQGEFGQDRTGAAYGAGVVRFNTTTAEARNVVGRLTRIKGAIQAPTHVLVQGRDRREEEPDGDIIELEPKYVWAIDPDWSVGDPIRQDFITYDSNSAFWLEKAGLRHMKRQKDRVHALADFEITPGQDEATGRYLPGVPASDRGNFWVGDTVTLKSGAGNDGDFNDFAARIAAIRMELGPAVVDGTGQQKERSWRVFVETGDDEPNNVAADSQGSGRAGRGHGGSCRCPELCAPGIACLDLTDSDLTAASATNGDAEDTGGGQWSGGGYTTARFHSGARSYQIATTTDGTIVYTFDPAQVFTAGVRYVLNVWKSGGGDHITNNVRFGVPGGDEVIEDNNDSVASGGGWVQHRICWTPTQDRTGVRLSYREQQTSGFFALDDLELNTAPDELAGTSNRGERCGHKHRAQDVVLYPPPGTSATNVQTGFEEVDERLDELEAGGGSGGGTTVGDFVAGDLSNPPTQAEVQALIGSPGLYRRGAVFGIQDSGNEKRYLALSDGVLWHIVPLVSPLGQAGVAALTSAPAGGWGQTHSAHYYNGKTYFAYVRGDNGNVEIRSYTHSTGVTSAATVMRAALLNDLHAAPSLVVRQSDRRIHAFYSDHAGAEMYQWISTNPEDISAGTETNLDAQLGGTGYTYAMATDLTSGLFLWVRYSGGAAPGQDWGRAVTTDDGATWSALTKFYEVAGGQAYPFVQKTGPDRVDFVAIDDTELASNQSIHYFSYNAATDVWTAADGTVLTLPIGGQAEIVVWDGSTLDEARGRFDVARGADGNPRVLFASLDGTDFTYRHARWDGTAWAFTALVTGTEPVIDGARFDSQDTNIVYLVNASNEIVRFMTEDEITWGSEVIGTGGTNVYPQSPVDHAPELAVLWMGGTVTSAASYSVGTFGFGAAVAADSDHLQRIVVLDDTELGELRIRRTSGGDWEFSLDGSTWESVGGGGPPTGAAGGDLSGAYPNPSVTDDSHAHTGATVPVLGPLLLASDHGTPIVFDDILQASDGADFIYASEP